MTELEDLPWEKAHVALYRTDPAKAHYIRGPARDGKELTVPTLLLTTIGGKSGLKRDVALVYGQMGDSFVVVASLGGAPDHPLWYKNLRVNPDAEINVGVAHHFVRARDAEGEERDRSWKLMLEVFPGYGDYAKRAEGVRELPVVVLDRR